MLEYFSSSTIKNVCDSYPIFFVSLLYYLVFLVHWICHTVVIISMLPFFFLSVTNMISVSFLGNNPTFCILSTVRLDSVLQTVALYMYIVMIAMYKMLKNKVSMYVCIYIYTCMYIPDYVTVMIFSFRMGSSLCQCEINEKCIKCPPVWT